MEDFNLIVGIHSIICALKNPKRNIYHLYATEDALEEIKKDVQLSSDKIKLCSSHKIQEEAKSYFKKLKLEYQRVPSGAFLVCSELELYSVNQLYDAVAEKDSLKILCLDQISDVHNAGAILRTANFYGVDFVVVPDKKSFGLTPSFFRIASGAAEYVPLVSSSKLTKVIAKLKSLNVFCVALSEHANSDFQQLIEATGPSKVCLVLGKEDTGISNAVLRLIDHHVSLESKGETQSLNVSAAAAISMEKCFGKL
ncbi:MAG: hypothetical protein CME62_16505 [Halobacteriovoraceae bacterium]|nr:hypothetical protein [Halobacteriovoraceae bacterium]|tara:strand:- start:2073 stop:2834 length:762 start_codon:yes stop_codon:yes gene_type:complete